MSVTLCSFCGVETAVLRCPCGKAAYCKDEHGKDDWPSHQAKCSYASKSPLASSRVGSEASRGDPYVCVYCSPEKEFTSQEAYYHHVATVHPDSLLGTDDPMDSAPALVPKAQYAEYQRSTSADRMADSPVLPRSLAAASSAASGTRGLLDFTPGQPDEAAARSDSEVCGKCGKKFDTEGTMFWHVYNEHPICVFCKERTAMQDKHAYKLHIVTDHWDELVAFRANPLAEKPASVRVRASSPTRASIPTRGVSPPAPASASSGSARLPPLVFGDMSKFIGWHKGIQGKNNSCYIDCALLSMFGWSDAFDHLIDKSLPSSQFFIDNVVKPLRAGKYVSGNTMMKLREMTTPEFDVTVRDIDELLRAFMPSIGIAPFISYTGMTAARTMSERDYSIQLFAPQKSDGQVYGVLSHTSFISQLAPPPPPALILHTTRQVSEKSDLDTTKDRLPIVPEVNITHAGKTYALSAVLCIDTSHYVGFLMPKFKEWIVDTEIPSKECYFFDSMATSKEITPGVFETVPQIRMVDLSGIFTYDYDAIVQATTPTYLGDENAELCHRFVYTSAVMFYVLVD